MQIPAAEAFHAAELLPCHGSVQYTGIKVLYWLALWRENSIDKVYLAPQTTKTSSVRN